MSKLNKDIQLLAIGQALTSTSVALLVSISSLAGLFLAPSAALSTIPVSATVLGTLVMIYPASTLMQYFGRRGGFMFKAALGIIGSIVAIISLLNHSFILLTIGTFILGLFCAFGQYYRFAALDAATTPEQKHRAIAVVTGAGVVGGIAGPYLASHFPALSPTPYIGAFVALTIVCILLAISQLFLSTELGKSAPSVQNTNNDPTATINWPLFTHATALCAIAFAVMTLMMNSAPLAMHHNHYSLQDSSLALQFHFAFMFLPSFFNPWIIRRIQIKGLVKIGIVMNIIGCLLSLLSEQTLLLYVAELALAGIGWNFIFNGGTLLLMNSYPSALKARAQGLNSLIVFSANMIASLLAGVLMAKLNWHYVNIFCLPLLLVAAYLLRKQQNISTTAKA